MMGILPPNYAQYCTSLAFPILPVFCAFPPLPLNEEASTSVNLPIPGFPGLLQLPGKPSGSAALKHLWDSLLVGRWRSCGSHATLRNCSAHPKAYDHLEPMTSQVSLHTQASHPNLISFVTQSRAATLRRHMVDCVYSAPYQKFLTNQSLGQLSWLGLRHLRWETSRRVLPLSCLFSRYSFISQTFIEHLLPAIPVLILEIELAKQIRHCPTPTPIQLTLYYLVL